MIYGLVLLAWMPLQAPFIRLLAVAAERLIWLIERPAIIIGLRAEGSALIISSIVQGMVRPLVVWNAWQLHLYVAVSLALVLAVPARRPIERLRLAGVALGVVGLVALLIAVTQVEATAEAQALLDLGIHLYSPRHLTLLNLANQALITVGMVLLPAGLFLMSYLRLGSSPGSIEGKRQRAHPWIRLVAAGAAVTAGLALVSARPPDGPGMLEALHRLRRLNPSSPQPYVSLGVRHEEAGRLAEAASDYETALAIDPTLAAARYALGNVLYKRGALHSAAEAYRETLRVDPSHTSARQNLGITLFEQGRYSEASPVFMEALQRQPQNAAAHHDLGLTLLRLDRPCEALPHLRQSARLDRRFASDPSLHAEIARLEAGCNAR